MLRLSPHEEIASPWTPLAKERRTLSRVKAHAIAGIARRYELLFKAVLSPCGRFVNEPVLCRCFAFGLKAPTRYDDVEKRRDRLAVAFAAGRFHRAADFFRRDQCADRRHVHSSPCLSR